MQTQMLLPAEHRMQNTAHDTVQQEIIKIEKHNKTQMVFTYTA